jgi:hypothetical protein
MHHTPEPTALLRVPCRLTAVPLEMGWRSLADLTTCPDIDLKSAASDGRFVRKDGTPYP